jgi:hypothetical protein
MPVAIGLFAEFELALTIALVRNDCLRAALPQRCPQHRAIVSFIAKQRLAEFGRQNQLGAGGAVLRLTADAEGRLDHVGFTSAISDAERPALTARLDALLGGEGFTGDAPGGPSRWSSGRSADWQALKPELVVEVCYDQVTDGRFRHGAMLVR